MRFEHAYLVVERHRYTSEPEASAGDPDAVGSHFSARLRTILDTVARDEGYGSLERLLDSPRHNVVAAPARGAHTRALVQASLLTNDGPVSVLCRGVVPDPIWAVLRGVEPAKGFSQNMPLPALRHRPQTNQSSSVDSWAVMLETAGTRRQLPLDPTTHPATRLPTAFVLDQLDRLASEERWSVLHLSEDRGIDDDASASFVLRQRYLLRRQR